MRQMIVVVLLFGVITILACLPGQQSVAIDPSAAPSPTPVIDPTTGLQVTFTPTATPTLTPTIRPTRTPRPPRTPSPTAMPTATPRPGILTTFQLDGNSTNVSVSGDFAYVTAKGAGVHVIDISTPLRPQLRDTILGSPDDLVVSGDLLLVLEVNTKTPLSAYDISDPLNARPLGVPAGINATQFSGVDAEGGLAVVSGGTSNMSILDITNIDEITLVASLPKELGFADVTLSGSRAFISSDVSGDFSYGIPVYDLSDPVRPILLETLGVPKQETISRVRMPANFDLSMNVVNNVLLLVGGGNLTVMLVPDVARVRTVTSLCIDKNCSDADAVHIAREGAFVVVSGGDITVFNVAVLARTFMVRQILTPGVARGLAIQDGIAYIADGGAGLTIVRIH